MAKKEITPESVWNEYETACNFKAGLNLYDNVRANENFYIGKQWEGVQSNGLPTPVSTSSSGSSSMWWPLQPRIISKWRRRLCPPPAWRPWGIWNG